MSNDVFAAADHSLFFDDAVPPELCCSICCGVLKDPKDTPCGCTFCTSCISTWLAKSSTCPTDRQPLRPSLLKPPHRIVASMLSRLRLRCPHHHKGCTVILTPDTVDQHEAICIFRGSYRRAIPPRPPASRPPTSTTTSTTSSDAAGTSTTPPAAANGSSSGPSTTTPAPVSRRRPRAPSMTNPSLGYDVSTTPISSLSSAALAAVPHAASLPGNVHVATSTVSPFPAAQRQSTATAPFPSFNPAITSPLFAQFSNMNISGASTTGPADATQGGNTAGAGAGLHPAFASGFAPMTGPAPSASAMGALGGAYGMIDHPFFRPVVYNPAVGLFGDPYACFRNAAVNEIFTLGGGNAYTQTPPQQQARARPVGRGATGGRRGVARGAAPTMSPGTANVTPNGRMGSTAQPPLSAPASAPTPTTPTAPTTTTITASPATPSVAPFAWPSSSFNSPGAAPASTPTTPVEPSSEGASAAPAPSLSSATVLPRTTSPAPQAAPPSSTPSGAPSTPSPTPSPQRNLMSFGTVTWPTPPPSTTTPQASPTPHPFSFVTASPGPVPPYAASSASSSSSSSLMGMQQEGGLSAAASSTTSQPLAAGGFPTSFGLASAAVPSLFPPQTPSPGAPPAMSSFSFPTPGSAGAASSLAPGTPTSNGNKRALPNTSVEAGAGSAGSGTTSGSGPATGPQADVAAPASTSSSSSSGTEGGPSSAPSFVFGRSSLPAFSLCVPETHQPPAASMATPPPRPQASN